MKLRFPLVLAGVLALGSSACTSGEIVDNKLQPLSLGERTTVTFYPVDPATGRYDALKPVYFYMVGPTSTVFSFDPLTPTTTNGTGGIANVSVQLPQGWYYASIVPSKSTPLTYQFNSPIFYHSYYTTCTDYFTGTNTPCAPYYLQVLMADNWYDANRAIYGQQYYSGAIPTRTNNGYRILPLIGYGPWNVAEPLSYGEPGGTGTISW
jgi:hypothetical protein